MVCYPKIFIRPHEKDPVWISIDITKRPFQHTKTNMKCLMIVSCYFKHIKVFTPTFFAILDDDQTPETFCKALIKFRSEILETLYITPSQILCSPDP